MKTNKKVLAVLVATALTLPAVASAQELAGLETAASDFSSTFITAASVIGGAMVTAAFGAIIWKWIRGMTFS